MARDPAAIEAVFTQLVQQAPALEPATIADALAQLDAIGSPLAQTMARVTARVVEGRVDPGIALPALAMAAATLADGMRGRLGERELEAARYEIDTLLPLPDGARPIATTPPDVPLTQLSRGPRRQT